jgi:hypothetical protein
MAARTFAISLRRVAPLAPLLEGCFSIVNEENDGTIELLELRATQGVLGVATAGVVRPGLFDIRTISAVTGGEALTTIKHDENEASLPSQVSIVRYPDAITSTATLRRLVDCPQAGNFQAAGAITATRLDTAFGGGGDLSSMMRIGGTGDVQPIVLNAGQGLAVVQSQIGLSHGMFALSGQVIVQGTGATHNFSTGPIVNESTNDDPLLAIFNATGSGVVLEVRGLRYRELAGGLAATQIPAVGMRLILSTGVDSVPESMATDVTSRLLPLDTVGPALTGVKVYAGPHRARALTEKVGTNPDWHTLHTGLGAVTGAVNLYQRHATLRGTTRVPVRFDGAGGTMPNPPAPGGPSELVWSTRGRSRFAEVSGNIVLRKGQGVSFVTNRENPSLVSESSQCFDLFALIAYTPTPRSGPSIRGRF